MSYPERIINSPMMNKNKFIEATLEIYKFCENKGRLKKIGQTYTDCAYTKKQYCINKQDRNFLIKIIKYLISNMAFSRLTYYKLAPNLSIVGNNP